MPVIDTLKSRQDFHSLYSKGIRYKLDYFMAIVLVSNTANQSLRISFNIKRKFFNAVHRNLIKRRLKNISSKYKQILHDCNIVFIVDRRAARCSYIDFENDIKKLCKLLKRC